MFKAGKRRELSGPSLQTFITLGNLWALNKE